MGKRGRLFRNKRGVATELLLEAMQAIAVILILTGTLAYVGNELAKIGFTKRFYARDLGLFTTTLHSAPGNIYYLYYIKNVDEKEPDKYKFNFNIANNLVMVNASNSPKTVAYWYFSDFGTEPIIYDESDRLGIIKFAKEGNRIKIGLAIKSNANKIICPVVYTEEAAWKQKKFILDPAHGESDVDKGAVSDIDENFYEADLANKIAIRMNISEQNKIYTRKKDAYAAFEERKEIIKDNTDALIISIHIGDDKDKTNNHIKAYYNINSDELTRKKSRKLGCKILNEVLEYHKLAGRDKINGVVVIASDSDYITGIIPAGRVGVLLELGNIQIPKQDNFLADTTDLAEVITIGIGNYYTK